MCSAVIALLVAFLSASQDIVIDAYRVDTIPPSERALAAAATTFGYRSAAMLAGTVLVLIAAGSNPGLALRGAFSSSVACLMAATMLATLWAPEPEVPGRPPTTLADAVWLPLRHLIKPEGRLGILAAGAALQGGRCLRAEPVQRLHDQGRGIFAGRN